MADVPSVPPPPPPGTPAGPDSLRPRSFGEILSGALRIYLDNATKLLVIVAIVVVPLSFISALATETVASPTETTVEVFGQPVTTAEPRSFIILLAAALIAAAIGVMIWAVLEAAILRGAAQATIGDPVDVQASYRWGFRRFGSVLLVAVLIGLVVVGGLILLIIPGLVFLVFLSVSIPALVIEDRRGREALKRSWNLVSGHFWHAVGVILVAAIIASLVSSLISAIGGDNWVVRWIFAAIAQIITAPFTALVGVLLYLDLRARKEALTANVLRAELTSS